MKLARALEKLPTTDKHVLAVLSGGLDSSIMTMILVKKYGRDNVFAVSYDYGQKQWIELKRAGILCEFLGISHKILNVTVLGDIVQAVSANIKGSGIDMPTIREVLGDPQPKTEVPFRNLILLSLTLAYAQATDSSHIFTGLQVHDQYSYWDTTALFVERLNGLAELNRKHPIKVEAPFSELNKTQELEICKELAALDLLRHTLTCYNPNILNGKSCGICPSCSERIGAFMNMKMKDPIQYSIEIPWKYE